MRDVVGTILWATPYFAMFSAPDLTWWPSANDPAEQFCERCKAFGRIEGNRICPDCKGEGVIYS